jgi:hypothetical protein
MLIRGRLARVIICALLVVFPVRITMAAECRQDNFGSWLEQFKQETRPISREHVRSFVQYGWLAGKPWTEGSPNFSVLQKWNESEVYAKTVGYFANSTCKRTLAISYVA